MSWGHTPKLTIVHPFSWLADPIIILNNTACLQEPLFPTMPMDRFCYNNVGFAFSPHYVAGQSIQERSKGYAKIYTSLEI